MLSKLSMQRGNPFNDGHVTTVIFVLPSQPSGELGL